MPLCLATVSRKPRRNSEEELAGGKAQIRCSEQLRGGELSCSAESQRRGLCLCFGVWCWGWVAQGCCCSCRSRARSRAWRQQWKQMLRSSKVEKTLRVETVAPAAAVLPVFAHCIA